jgi:hypothetical protein
VQAAQGSQTEEEAGEEEETAEEEAPRHQGVFVDYDHNDSRARVDKTTTPAQLTPKNLMKNRMKNLGKQSFQIAPR